MDNPIYVGLREARKILANIGVELSDRQMKRAADKDAQGRRKLPFFVDPITGKLKIEKGDLIAAYNQLQVAAQQNIRTCDSDLPASPWVTGGQLEEPR